MKKSLPAEAGGIEELKKQVQKIKWYHRIDLGNGIITPGTDNSSKKLRTLGLPPSLAGKTVLDVGAWDGYFSFEAERRGAARVLATDSFCWGRGGETTKEGFELARRVLGSRVEDLNIDALELSPQRVGTFDIVLFLGILYHMRHPLLALEHAASVAKDQIIVETVVDCLHCKRPVIAFYPQEELANDPSNWCGPSPSAVMAMLKTVGFRRVEVIANYRPFLFRLGRALHYNRKLGYPFLSMLRTCRMVFHAWK